jgi:CRISPR-associated protein Cas1
MTNRIVEISDQVAGLKISNRLLEISLQSGQKLTVVPTDISVLLLSTPHVRLSQAVLSSVTEAGGFVVVVNNRFLPSGMLLPLDAHSTQSEIMRVQVEAGLPLKKRLWKQIVQQKIIAQGHLLQKLHGDDSGLFSLAERVRSGDSENIEARASRKYWQKIFKNSRFIRDRGAEDQNMLLNYGYTVLRACVARAICAAGLHPSFGLHHHNRYNAFCLADDLMEPFRPLVDLVVVEMDQQDTPDYQLTPDVKRQLLLPLTRDVQTERGNEKLFALLSRTAASLVRCFRGESSGLILPEKIK